MRAGRKNQWRNARFLVATSVLAGAVLTAACGDDDGVHVDGGTDAGPPMYDAGPGDAGPGDSGPGDSGPGDSGEADGGAFDAGDMDAGFDAGTGADAGFDAGAALCYSGSTAPVVIDPRLNLTAVHDPSSRRYDGRCLQCHGAILALTTLDPAVTQVHRRMIPFVPTYACPPGIDDEDCVFCHNAVDFSGNRSAGNLRRQVAMATCRACHRAGTFDFYLP